jgi:hypothetical protein
MVLVRQENNGSKKDWTQEMMRYWAWEGKAYVREGFISPQYCIYTEFMSAKSSILVRNTLTLTTLVLSVPASLRTWLRFLMH